MSSKRKDNKGRVLHNGEYQQSNGRYRYKYYDGTGKARYLYSWRLDKNDRMPDGKRQGKSLREQEQELQATQFGHIALDGGNLTVLELVRRYTATKIGVRESTKAGYQTTTAFFGHSGKNVVFMRAEGVFEVGFAPSLHPFFQT